MVKINDPRNKSGDTPRVRGAFLTLVRGDTAHVQAWPKKRGKGGSPGKTYQEMKMGFMGRMAANVQGMDVLTATEMTKDTQQVPRDFITWCIQGLGYELVNEDGFIWPARATMTTNPQYVLDDVSNTEGDMLWRSPIGWVGLNRGLTGQMLWQGADGPEWQNPPGASTARPKITTLQRTTNQATSNSTIHVASWESALIDENAAWSAANPTRLLIPSTAQYIRLSATLKWLGVVVTSIYEPQTRRNDGSTTFQGCLTGQLLRFNTSGSNRIMQLVGPWFPKPANSYFELQYTQAVNETSGFLAGSSFSMECTY